MIIHYFDGIETKYDEKQHTAKGLIMEDGDMVDVQFAQPLSQQQLDNTCPKPNQIIKNFIFSYA